MKRLILLITMIVSAVAIFATQQKQYCVPMSVEPQEEERSKNHPDRGQRMPAAPVQVILDFENYRISGTSPYLEHIVEYEVYSADSDECLVSCSNEIEFLESLEVLGSREYIIVLRNDVYSLTGMVVI